MTLELVPVTLRQARGFVLDHHRHHGPPAGHKVSLGVQVDGRLVGVAILGRPVARMLDDGWTLEVVRTCTDGTPNANSFLYGASWRVARALGYRKLVTYTEEGESGASLRAVGWCPAPGLRVRDDGWTRPSRTREKLGTEGRGRTRWEIAR